MSRRTILVVALVLAACGREGAPATADSGIEGRTLAGPQCPVVQVGSPCPDAPIVARVRVETGEGSEVVTFESAEDGTFRVLLAPGTYRLLPEAEGTFGGKPVDVTVPPGEFVRVDVFLDTGIR